MKVVIVDDEWMGLDVTYRLLTQVTMDLELVAFFQDPREALQQIPVLKPDLVILDLEMPDINGLELYEQLKGMKAHFMIISAHSQALLREREGLNNVSILTKPFCKADISSLLEAIDLTG